MLPSVSHSCGECGRRASALLPWLGPHILLSLFVSPARPELCLHTCPRDRLGHHSPNRRLPYFCPSPQPLLAAPPSGLAGFCLLSGPCLPRCCTLSPACASLPCGSLSPRLRLPSLWLFVSTPVSKSHSLRIRLQPSPSICWSPQVAPPPHTHTHTHTRCISLRMGMKMELGEGSQRLLPVRQLDGTLRRDTEAPAPPGPRPRTRVTGAVPGADRRALRGGGAAEWSHPGVCACAPPCMSVREPVCVCVCVCVCTRARVRVP